MELQQKGWAVFDTVENKIAKEYDTRDEAREDRGYSWRYQGLNGKPNFKRFRIARLNKTVQVEILSK